MVTVMIIFACLSGITAMVLLLASMASRGNLNINPRPMKSKEDTMPHPYDENDKNWTACLEGYTCERCKKEKEEEEREIEEAMKHVRRCHCGGTIYEHAESCSELRR